MELNRGCREAWQSRHVIMMQGVVGALAEKGRASRMLRVGTVCLILSWLLVGCGSDDGQKPVVTIPAVELECEASGEPCALSEVPLEVLERGEVLAAQLLQMIEGGMSFADARIWVSQQQGVVDAEGDDTAIIFRVDGGRDIWIVDDSTLGSVLSPPPASVSSARSLIPRKSVVGDEPTTKHALILSPFKHDFGVYDEGSELAVLLEATRGYSGNVRYEENATTDSTVVGISDFKGWGKYDVVHVSSHGLTNCNANGCKAVIYTGESYGSTLELLEIAEAGVDTLHVVDGQSHLFAVGTDFFKREYPGGLKKTLVMFNACQTFGAGDFNLGISIIGDDSVFLGWSETVLSDAAKAAALALYKDLSDNGLTAGVAWSNLGSLAINDYISKGKPIHAELQLGMREGRDLRLREIVFVEHPSSGNTLSDGTEIPYTGTVGDGIGDVIPYQIKVDGIKDDEIEGYTLTVTLDGLSAELKLLSDGQKISENAYRINGELMFRDLTGIETLNLQAVVTLPDQGISEHSVSVVVGDSLVVGDDGEPCPGIPAVIYAGQTYNTVQIGDQCWLKENLNVGTMITTSKDNRQDQINNGTIERYCYDNNPINCDTYGGLYQWNEAMQYSGPQDICPEEWHIPTLADFETLTTAVDSDGNSLKSIGEGTGTNTSGFSALLAGQVASDVFTFVGRFTSFWSSTETGSFDKVNSIFLNVDISDIQLGKNVKDFGISIRCVKN